MKKEEKKSTQKMWLCFRNCSGLLNDKSEVYMEIPNEGQENLELELPKGICLPVLSFRKPNVIVWRYVHVK